MINFNFPKNLFHALLLILALLLSLFGNAQDLKLQPIEKDIDKVFEKWNHDDQPGIAAGIISNGKVIYKKGFGAANLEHNIPISTSTIFHAGNWNRQFTAFAIILLEDQGKLSLQDDIRKYIPEIPDFGKKITLHHLLSHTSGLDDYAVLKPLAGWNDDDTFTKQHAFHFLKNQKKLNHNPGEKYQINRTGSMVLEDVVAIVSGKSYAQFVEEEIFAPLNMKHTFVLEHEGKIISNKATGYRTNGKYFKIIPSHFAPVGPSDLYTNIDDILKWISNFRNPKVGNTAIINKMDTPVLLKNKPVELKNGALYLGQHRHWNFKGTNKLYIIGDIGGYACKIVRFPDQDFSAVVLGNDGAYNGYSTSFLADLFLEKYYPNPPVHITSSSDQKEVALKKLSASQMKKAEGTYWNSDRFFTTKIELQNDTLRYSQVDFNWKTELEIVDENTFHLVDGGNLIKLKNNNGKKEITITLGDGTRLISNFYSKNENWANDLSVFVGTYYSEKLGTSYVFEIEDGKLIASHIRLQNIIFTPLVENTFQGSNPDFLEITFEKDQNIITGFQLRNRKLKNITFKKMKAGMEN